MDYLAEISHLGLASRLRRLYERLASDGVKVYQDKKINFKISWFPVFHALSIKKSMTISELSESLIISHPAIIEVTDELIGLGYLVSSQDKKDKRKRYIKVTRKGKGLSKKLKPIWNAFREATQDLFRETGCNLINEISLIESALIEKSLHERITGKLKK